MARIINKRLAGIKVPRREEDDSLEILKAFNQHDIENGANFAFKKAHVKVNSILNKKVPSKSVYQQELVGILKNWLAPFLYEIIGQYHTKGPLDNEKYCNVVLTETDTSGGSTAILELLATSRTSELKEHYTRALQYANSLSDPSSPQSLNIRDMWVVHFTCEDNTTNNCNWPTSSQNLRDFSSNRQ